MSQRLYMRLDNGPLEPCEFRVYELPMCGTRCIDVACPRCGAVTTLEPETYKTRRDGAVTPIWRCGKCPAVEWLILEGAT